jgi:uncharacterized protein YukE
MVVRKFTSPTYKLSLQKSREEALLAKEEGGGKYQPTEGNKATRQPNNKWRGGSVKRYFEVARRSNKAMNDGSKITRQHNKATKQCDEATKQREKTTRECDETMKHHEEATRR